MIVHHEDKQITSVTFGKEGKGAVSVGSARHFLVLQELAKPKKIADTIREDDTKPLPRVELEFFDTKSIDVMIKMLNEVKHNMEYPHGTLCLAC